MDRAIPPAVEAPSPKPMGLFTAAMKQPASETPPTAMLCIRNLLLNGETQVPVAVEAGRR